MKRRLVRVAIGVTILVLCSAAVRLAWLASQTESGWETIGGAWHSATLGWFSVSRTLVNDKDPTEQADYWLHEVDRIAAAHPDSASIHMGAAWVLDSPGKGFLGKHVRSTDYSGPPQLGMQLDWDTIRSAEAEFNHKCRERCVSLAAKATQLDPTDVRWWRMRALLLFEGESVQDRAALSPRDENWDEVLQECAKNDPENALYDYLAAVQYWERSAKLDRSDEQPPLTIHDPVTFALGSERFLQAQQKPFLAIGEAGYPAIAEFLAHSRLSKTEQAEIAVSRLVTFRQSNLVALHLYRWQEARTQAAQRDDDPQQQVEVLRQTLRLYDQASAPEETSALNMLTTFGVLRTIPYEAIEALVREHPNLIEPAQMDAIRQREEALRIETSILQGALRKGIRQESNAGSLSIMLFGLASFSAALLLALAVLMLIAGLLLHRPLKEPPRFGLHRHAIAWFIGGSLTYLVLGMAPAEMISRPLQTGIAIAAIALLALCVAAAAAWLVFVLLYRRKYRYSLRTLFALMTAAAVLASLWPVVASAAAHLHDHPPELWLRAWGWGAFGSDFLRLATRAEKGTWQWATMQWIVHGGPYASIAMSLLIVTVWYMRRTARASGQRFLAYWMHDVKLRWSVLLRTLGETSLAAATVWLLAFLLAAPDVVRRQESAFQHKMRYCRDPQSHYQEFRAAQRAIESSREM